MLIPYPDITTCTWLNAEVFQEAQCKYPVRPAIPFIIFVITEMQNSWFRLEAARGAATRRSVGAARWRESLIRS